MDFIAGVDGGGTKTKVVCASPEGKVLDTAVFGPFNMNRHRRGAVLRAAAGAVRLSERTG